VRSLPFNFDVNRLQFQAVYVACSKGEINFVGKSLVSSYTCISSKIGGFHRTKSGTGVPRARHGFNNVFIHNEVLSNLESASQLDNLSNREECHATEVTRLNSTGKKSQRNKTFSAS
jgi:hypothetical protein